MAREFNGHVVGQLHLFAGPEVFCVLGAVQAELREIQMKWMR